MDWQDEADSNSQPLVEWLGIGAFWLLAVAVPIRYHSEPEAWIFAGLCLAFAAFMTRAAWQSWVSDPDRVIWDRET